jgi:DUF4097 and DUF4098 domain-containing protein YvlB
VIALAFVCLGIGAVIFFTANGFQTNNPFDRNNISSELEESKSLKVDATKPLILKVVDDSGDVNIAGADVKAVQVKAVKTAYDSSQARADQEVKGIKYTIEQNGNTITLRYELPKSMNFSNKVNTIDFFVTVPHETAVNVDTGMGEVSVADTRGKVIIESSFGELKVENVEGALSASSGSGAVSATAIKAGSEDIDLKSEFGTVNLRNASGKNITLDSSSGAITLREVRATGNITAKTNFGDTTFENGSANSLSTENSSGAVSFVKIQMIKEIKVQNDFGKIDLQQAFATSYDLHTSSGSITVEGAKGKLKAYTDFGGIKVGNAQSVTLDLKTSSGTVEFSGSLGDGHHQVKSDFGQIDLTLPGDSKLDVDLKTDFGNIKSDLPVTVMLNQTSNSNGDQIVGSINGGGSQLTAQTSSGSVNLHAGK